MHIYFLIFDAYIYFDFLHNNSDVSEGDVGRVGYRGANMWLLGTRGLARDYKFTNSLRRKDHNRINFGLEHFLHFCIILNLYRVLIKFTITFSSFLSEFLKSLRFEVLSQSFEVL